MFEPLWNWASKRYTAAVGAQLKEYGLRFDDLYDPLHDLVRTCTLAINSLPCFKPD